MRTVPLLGVWVTLPAHPSWEEMCTLKLYVHLCSSLWNVNARAGEKAPREFPCTDRSAVWVPARGPPRCRPTSGRAPGVRWGGCSRWPRRRCDARGVTYGSVKPGFGSQLFPLTGLCLPLGSSTLLLYFFPHYFLLCFTFPLKWLGFCLTQLMPDSSLKGTVWGKCPPDSF